MTRTVRVDYAKETGHNAIAVHLPTGFSFRWNGAASPELAVATATFTDPVQDVRLLGDGRGFVIE